MKIGIKVAPQAPLLGKFKMLKASGTFAAGNPVAIKPKAYIEEFKVTEDKVFVYSCLEIKRAAWGVFCN